MVAQARPRVGGVLSEHDKLAFERVVAEAKRAARAELVAERVEQDVAAKSMQRIFRGMQGRVAGRAQRCEVQATREHERRMPADITDDASLSHSVLFIFLVV